MPKYVFEMGKDGESYDKANDITLKIDTSAGDRANWKIHLSGAGVPTATKKSTAFFNTILGENDIYIPHDSKSTQDELAKIITAGLAPFKFAADSLNIRYMGKCEEKVVAAGAGGLGAGAGAGRGGAGAGGAGGAGGKGSM